MAIKVILCPFHGEMSELNALASAFNLAGAEGADVRVLCVASPRHAYPLSHRPAGPGLAVMDRVAPLEDLLVAAEQDRIARSEHYASEYAARAGMIFCDDGNPQFSDVGVRARFRVRVGDPRDILPLESRSCDLVLTGYDNKPDGDLSGVLAALSRARCPLLLVPYSPGATIPATGWPRTVVIGWDDSEACAQAVRGAMPFLVRAKSVVVVRIMGTPDTASAQLEMDTRRYLASYGVTAEFVHSPRAQETVGEALLSRTRETHAHLLVMGSYGRGHMREMLLGGTTDHVLKHTHLPILLAH